MSTTGEDTVSKSFCFTPCQPGRLYHGEICYTRAGTSASSIKKKKKAKNCIKRSKNAQISEDVDLPQEVTAKR